MNWPHYWKSILAFLSLLATNASADLTLDSDPWPQTGAEWMRWLVTTAGGTWLVWVKRNAEKPGVSLGQ